MQVFEQGAVREDEKLDFVRRQTLKSGQRYTTQYLENLQVQILNARDELQKKEHEFLVQAKEKIQEHINELTAFGNSISELDVYTSFALFSLDNQLVKPEISLNTTIKIDEGRHLVIEKYLDDNQHFITNSLEIGTQTSL